MNNYFLQKIYEGIRHDPEAINEKFLGTYDYEIPTDAEEQVYDFYFTSLLPDPKNFEEQMLAHLQSSPENATGFGVITQADGLSEAYGDTVKKLYDHLQTDLLDATYFAIAAEMRHVFDHNSFDDFLLFATQYDYGQQAKKYYQNLQYAKQYGDVKKLVADKMDRKNPLKQLAIRAKLYKNPLEKDDAEQFFRNEPNYIKSYVSAKNAFKDDWEFIDFAEKCFFKPEIPIETPEPIPIEGEELTKPPKDKLAWPLKYEAVEDEEETKKIDSMEWASAYGGEKWALIAKGWKSLNNAETRRDQMVYIDHILDLEHNTGAMLNKVHRYSKESSWSWIKTALDFKKYAVVPLIQFMPRISQSMRQLANTMKLGLFGYSDENQDEYLKSKIAEVGVYTKVINNNPGTFMDAILDPAMNAKGPKNMQYMGKVIAAKNGQKFLITKIGSKSGNIYGKALDELDPAVKKGEIVKFSNRGEVEGLVSLGQTSVYKSLLSKQNTLGLNLDEVSEVPEQIIKDVLDEPKKTQEPFLKPEEPTKEGSIKVGDYITIKKNQSQYEHGGVLQVTDIGEDDIIFATIINSENTGLPIGSSIEIGVNSVEKIDYKPKKTQEPFLKPEEKGQIKVGYYYEVVGSKGSIGKPGQYDVDYDGIIIYVDNIDGHLAKGIVVKETPSQKGLKGSKVTFDTNFLKEIDYTPKEKEPIKVGDYLKTIHYKNAVLHVNRVKNRGNTIEGIIVDPGESDLKVGSYFAYGPEDVIKIDYKPKETAETPYNKYKSTPIAYTGPAGSAGIKSLIVNVNNPPRTRKSFSGYIKIKRGSDPLLYHDHMALGSTGYTLPEYIEKDGNLVPTGKIKHVYANAKLEKALCHNLNFKVYNPVVKEVVIYGGILIDATIKKGITFKADQKLEIINCVLDGCEFIDFNKNHLNVTFINCLLKTAFLWIDDQKVPMTQNDFKNDFKHYIASEDLKVGDHYTITNLDPYGDCLVKIKEVYLDSLPPKVKVEILNSEIKPAYYVNVQFYVAIDKLGDKVKEPYTSKLKIPEATPIEKIETGKIYQLISTNWGKSTVEIQQVNTKNHTVYAKVITSEKNPQYAGDIFTLDANRIGPEIPNVP